MDVVIRAITIKNRESRDFRSKTDTTFLFACAFLSGGLFALSAGILFFIIHPFLTDDNISNRIGSIFSYPAIPLLLVGSHFLDKFGEKKRMTENLADRAGNAHPEGAKSE